tara:strand:+ start:3114 stop:6737 length:3624 start_codon:yes stop_codon:yes gene_type:complete
VVTNNTNIKGDLLQEENAISYQPDTTWLFNPNVSFGEDVNKDGFSWSQFFQGTANHSQGFLDTRHGEAFMEGFKDENFVALAIDHYINPPPHFQADPVYLASRDDDVMHRQLYLSDPDYFGQAKSYEHFEYLIKKKKEQMKLYETSGAYISGRVFGGVTDISSIFLMSKMATPIYQGSKINRAVQTSKVLGVEEIGKQVIDQDRTWQEGATIIGSNFIINMLLPRFKGLTSEDHELIKKFTLHNDLIDEKNATVTSKSVNIKEGPTLKYRNAELGKTIKIKEGDPVPDGYEEVGAFVNTTDGVTTIYINYEKIAQDFKNKVWTKPKTKGVTPLKADAFKTVDEYTEFVLKHEKAHTYIKRNKGESQGEYENRINAIALKLTYGKTSVPINSYNINESNKFNQNHQKYLEELENETFKETILKSLGESSNWNPIQRLVNSGNLDAIKFGKSIMKLPFLTKGNFEGVPSMQTLEQWLKADNKKYGYTIFNVEEIYKKYKQTTTDTPISFKEFKQRISYSLINDNYQDSIPAVMSAKKQVKSYYDYVGKKIKDSEVRVNEQEILIGSLQSKLNTAKGNKVVITSRARDGSKSIKEYTKKEFQDIIDKEIKFLEQLKKSPLRKNYLNRFVNQGKIKQNVEEYRAFAKASLARTNPTYPEEVIDDLVRQYEESFPWQRYEPINPDKSMDDVIIDRYFFAPSTVSKNLKRRGEFVLDHEEWMRAGYMESDAFILMNVYHKSVLPDTYLASIFGTADAMGGQFLAKKGYQKGLVDISKGYEDKFNKATTSTEKSNIIKERNAVLKDMEAVRDLFKGTHGVSPDPTKFWSRGVRLTKHFNAWTSLQGATASIVDLGRSLFFNGLQRSLKTTYESFSKGISKDIYKIALKENRMSGEGWDMLLNTRALTYNDLDNVYGSLDRIERGANKMSSIFFMANLMSPWNQVIKTHNSMIIVTRILEECENWVNGTITQLNKAKLAQAGIGLDDAKRIMQQYVNHGQGKGSYKGVSPRNDSELDSIRLAKSFDWFDQDIAKKFQLAVQNDVNISIVTPSLADTPLWMSTELGSLVAQFKKFGMGMTNRVLIRGLQERDANFYGGIMMLIVMGMIVDQMRARAFDIDYSQKSEAEKFKAGFERSGVGGIFTDIYMGLERIIFGDMGDKAGAIGGPTGSQLDKFQHILFTNEPSTRASNVRRIIPFNNIHYADGFFDSLEKGMQ